MIPAVASSAVHPSARVPTVEVISSDVHGSAEQTVESHELMGGIHEEFDTVEKMATVPGRLRQVAAGLEIRPVMVL